LNPPFHFLFVVTANLLRLLGKTGFCAIGEIALSEPLTGLDDLDDVNPLFEEHDGGGDDYEDPRKGAIHLVCSVGSKVSNCPKVRMKNSRKESLPSHLHGTSGPRAGKDSRGLGRCSRRTRLQRGTLSSRLQQTRAQVGAREGQQIQGDEEQLVQCATHKQHIAVGVVQVHDLASFGVDVLVAASASAHGEGGVHVHVVGCEVERDEELEDHAPARHGCREEDEQAGGGAAIRHHVQDGSKLGGLVEATGGIAIESVEEAGYAVQQSACTWVEGHVIQ